MTQFIKRLIILFIGLVILIGIPYLFGYWYILISWFISLVSMRYLDED